MSPDGSVHGDGLAIETRDPPVMLADVLRRLDCDGRLDCRRAAEMSSALRRICKALHADPSTVPAEPRLLRPRLAKLTPAMAGVTPKRWTNIKSLLFKALKHVGFTSMAGRSREPLAPAWEQLRDLLPDRYFKSGLSRFMSYSTNRGLGPYAITAQTFVEFGAELEASSLARDPGALHRETTKLWNRAARTIPGWPQSEVEVPDRRRTFALPADRFPASFSADLNRFLATSAETDVFSETYSKRLAPATLKDRRGRS
jgi:hypothetical protein